MATPPPLTADDALLLDFDGTLVGIAARPELVRPADDLADVLVRLREATGGAVAVITGRPLAEVDGFLSPVQLAGAGLHGMQLRLPDGTTAPAVEHPALEGVRQALAAFAARHDGLMFEDKGAAVALHYRAVPAMAEACRAAVHAAVTDADDLEVLDGKAVLEVRPKGVHKGTAAARLAELAPFAGRRLVVAGDDVTDEDTFATALALGGIAIKIGAGPTRAPYRLADADAFVGWLRDQSERLTSPQGTST